VKFFDGTHTIRLYAVYNLAIFGLSSLTRQEGWNCFHVHCDHTLGHAGSATTLPQVTFDLCTFLLRTGVTQMILVESQSPCAFFAYPGKESVSRRKPSSLLGRCR